MEQNIWLLLLIELDISTTILPKNDALYLLIWLLYLVTTNSACRLPQIITDHLCILAIIPPLSTVAKTFYCNDSKLTEFEMIDN